MNLGVDAESITAGDGRAAALVAGSIARASQALIATQQPDGHFVFELEADATIPAEYVLLTHYRGETPDVDLERKIAVYLRRIQGTHGGWPLFDGGLFNMSASVKAYFALKMIGDDINAPHMVRARAAILANGGAAESNVFTRFLLALYGIIPWRGVPVMPVEIMLLPRWFPFHIAKISYWARTVLIPLTVLAALKPRAVNPRGVGLSELFTTAPTHVGRWPKGPHQKWPWAPVFAGIDRVLRVVEPHFPAGPRKRAVERAAAFVTERLNGENGLGAIFPAMANSIMMFDAMGIPATDERVKTARRSLDKLLVVTDQEAYCQPCLSPVWDTALVAHTLLELGDDASQAKAERALQWLRPLQVLDVKGDWAMTRPNVRPGGWAFQYANPHYPDLDDTAVVVMAMDRAKGRSQGDDTPRMARGVEWILGLQSRNGGFGAFDADNNYDYLNHIPFSDHGALLDPPTADVTARCVSMLAQIGHRRGQSPALDRATDYLLQDQEADGSWFGRWGMNYIYGTWSVLCALNAAGLEPGHPAVRRAVAWLRSIQNPDGGWGEDGESYREGYKGYEPAPSTASQTAWAAMGLMAAGEVDGPAVGRAIAFLATTQNPAGLWDEARFTATGFPRVFYLRYHGYGKFFPLWALARYRNLKASNTRTVTAGM